MNVTKLGFSIVPGKFPSLGGSIIDTGKELQASIEKQKNFGLFVLGIATLTVMLALIYNFTKLAASGDNPMDRKQAIVSIIISGVCLMILGSVDTYVFFFKI